jgi:hypothetical protein
MTAVVNDRTERPAIAATTRGAAPRPLALTREEISAALGAVRRRNRLAAVGFGVASLLAVGAFGALWRVKAAQAEDPMRLILQSPVEVRSPFLLVPAEGGNDGSPGAPKGPSVPHGPSAAPEGNLSR